MKWACFWAVVLEKTLESPLDCREIQPVHPKGAQSWKDWCWSWNSNTLATSCEDLTHWKRLWCGEGLGAGGEGDNWGWDGWMVSWTRWTWVWVNCRRWWWTGRPGVLRFMESQRVGHDWATELNWTALQIYHNFSILNNTHLLSYSSVGQMSGRLRLQFFAWTEISGLACWHLTMRHFWVLLATFGALFWSQEH